MPDNKKGCNIKKRFSSSFCSSWIWRSVWFYKQMLLWESMAENKDRQEGTNKTGKEWIRRFCSLLFSFLVLFVISQPEPSCLNLVDDEHALAFGSCFQVTKNHLGYPKGKGTLNIRMLSWRIEVAIQNIVYFPPVSLHPSSQYTSSLFYSLHLFISFLFPYNFSLHKALASHRSLIHDILKKKTSYFA